MYLIDLSEARDANQAGGKASQLSQAIHLGFLVPAGVVLTRAALGCFLAQNRLEARIHLLLENYSSLDWATQNKQFDHISQQIQASPVPQKIQTGVNPVIEQLLKQSPDGIAVRSSSHCEDLKTASFAGIYDSFLGITSLEDFWQKVLCCWCSAWSPRAAAYAHKMGIALPMDGMAVLVQKLIAATSSGVIFTANPATGNPWEFILNATPGLAMHLVDGSAPADRYTMEWDSGKILDRQVAIKPNALLVEKGSLVKKNLKPEEQHEQALSDPQIQAVAQMALALDRAFDQRLDIEWAMDGEQLFLIQARPLTTLPLVLPGCSVSPGSRENLVLTILPS